MKKKIYVYKYYEMVDNISYLLLIIVLNIVFKYCTWSYFSLYKYNSFFYKYL